MNGVGIKPKPKSIAVRTVKVWQVQVWRCVAGACVRVEEKGSHWLRPPEASNPASTGEIVKHRKSSRQSIPRPPTAPQPIEARSSATAAPTDRMVSPVRPLRPSSALPARLNRAQTRQVVPPVPLDQKLMTSANRLPSAARNSRAPTAPSTLPPIKPANAPKRRRIPPAGWRTAERAGRLTSVG